MGDLPLDRLDELWDFGDPAASEQRFRAFFGRARTADEPILAEVLTQLARAPGAATPLRRRRPHARRGGGLAASGRRPRSRPPPPRAWTGREHRGARRTRDRVVPRGVGASPESAARTLSPSTRPTCSGSSSRPTTAGRGTSVRWSSLGARRTRPRDAGSRRSPTTWPGHDTPRATYDEALGLFRLALEERQRDGRPGRSIRIARWSVSRLSPLPRPARRSAGRARGATRGARCARRVRRLRRRGDRRVPARARPGRRGDGGIRARLRTAVARSGARRLGPRAPCPSPLARRAPTQSSPRGGAEQVRVHRRRRRPRGRVLRQRQQQGLGYVR